MTIRWNWFTQEKDNPIQAPFDGQDYILGEPGQIAVGHWGYKNAAAKTAWSLTSPLSRVEAWRPLPMSDETWLTRKQARLLCSEIIPEDSTLVVRHRWLMGNQTYDRWLVSKYDTQTGFWITKTNTKLTDESAISFALIHHPLSLAEGLPENAKITGPLDIVWA